MLSNTHTRPRSPTAPEAVPDTMSDSVNDRAVRRAPRLAARAGSQRKVPLAHPRATPPSRWRMTSQGLRP
jgi:hypothetical protein